VIISACNTAAGGAEGAEALSGLARAFFYAGARALLVSHWAVASDATVKLITGAMERMASGSGVGRAEAMRQSMLALIDKGTDYEAHPAFWAPFVVVGEGAARYAGISALLKRSKRNGRRAFPSGSGSLRTNKDAHSRACRWSLVPAKAVVPQCTSPPLVLGRAFLLRQLFRKLGVQLGQLARLFEDRLLEFLVVQLRECTWSADLFPLDEHADRFAKEFQRTVGDVAVVLVLTRWISLSVEPRAPPPSLDRSRPT
jgi:hypothetical protein